MSDGMEQFLQALDAIKAAEEHSHKAHELIAKLPRIADKKGSLQRAWIKANDAEGHLIVAQKIVDRVLEDYEFAIGESSLASKAARS